MSSNINQRTYLSETNIRQSFDERICDDLSEVILQYLSLEDKLRLECVSKQFQKTIFVKHYKLKIQYNGISYDFNKTLTSLESLLKKCPNIKSVDFGFWTDDVFDNICQLLIDFCHNLNQIKCYQNFYYQMWIQLKQKFGSKLVSLNILQFNPQIINHFSNIRVLKTVFSFYLSDICGLELKNLKQLTINYDEEEAIHLKTFIEKYKNLTHLTVSAFDCDPKVIKNLLTQLLKLEELVHFSIETHSAIGNDINDEMSVIGINDISLINTITEMTNKWLKLKSFGGYLKPEKDSNGVLKKFQTINGFKQLKRLKLWIDYRITFNDLIQLLGTDFLESLTHLNIEYGLYYDIYNEPNQINLVQSMKSNLKLHFPKLRVCLKEQ